MRTILLLTSAINVSGYVLMGVMSIDRPAFELGYYVDLYDIFVMLPVYWAIGMLIIFRRGRQNIYLYFITMAINLISIYSSNFYM